MAFSQTLQSRWLPNPANFDFRITVGEWKALRQEMVGFPSIGQGIDPSSLQPNAHLDTSQPHVVIGDSFTSTISPFTGQPVVDFASSAHGLGVLDSIAATAPDDTVLLVENLTPGLATGQEAQAAPPRGPAFLNFLNMVSIAEQQGLPIEFMSLSFGPIASLQQLSQVTGLPLGLGNYEALKPELTNRLTRLDPFIGAELQGLATLEQQGIDVFVAGGNSGPGGVNLYELAPGVSAIGAFPSPLDGNFFSSVAGVDWFTNGLTGFDQAIGLSRSFNGDNPNHLPLFLGTSASAPMAVGQVLAGQANDLQAGFSAINSLDPMSFAAFGQLVQFPTVAQSVGLSPAEQQQAQFLVFQSLQARQQGVVA